MKNYCGKSILANYYRGFEAVGGKLYFDETGITFESHGLNIQTGKTTIPYSEIVSAKKRGLFTGMSVFTRDGFEHKFVVYHRTCVIDYLNEKAIASMQ